MALPTVLIQSSFCLSSSAMKNIESLAVAISNEHGFMMVSSAPLMLTHLERSMTPRGTDWGVTLSSCSDGRCFSMMPRGTGCGATSRSDMIIRMEDTTARRRFRAWPVATRAWSGVITGTVDGESFELNKRRAP